MNKIDDEMINSIITPYKTSFFLLELDARKIVKLCKNSFGFLVNWIRKLKHLTDSVSVLYKKKLCKQNETTIKWEKKKQ